MLLRQGIKAIKPRAPRPVLDETSPRSLKAADSTQNRADWQRGVVLPNETFKLMHPSEFTPENEVHFKVPIYYNKYQIKNYLEQIYNVKVLSVHTMVNLGKTKRLPHKVKTYKQRDWKKAMVQIQGGFKYPTIEEIKKM
jgi:large subunit ribosomal protein L23